MLKNELNANPDNHLFENYMMEFLFFSISFRTVKLKFQEDLFFLILLEEFFVHLKFVNFHNDWNVKNDELDL